MLSEYASGQDALGFNRRWPLQNREPDKMAWPGRFGKRVATACSESSNGARYRRLGTLDSLPVPTVPFRLTAGRAVGSRHRIAQALQRAAKKRSVAIELDETAGSAEALQAVASADVDVALVQGGLTMELTRACGRSRRSTASFAGKADDARSPVVSESCACKAANVGEPGSGTDWLATEVMAFFPRLRAGSDYTADGSHLRRAGG